MSGHRDKTMNASPQDGYVRMTLHEMRTLSLVHLVSGLDEADRALPRCGARTTITGYTEWIGGTGMDVTLGWDWRVDMSGPLPLWRRCGTPRSNVMLLDGGGRDVEWRKNLMLLGAVVDRLPWAEQARSAIAMRYAA